MITRSIWIDVFTKNSKKNEIKDGWNVTRSIKCIIFGIPTSHAIKLSVCTNNILWQLEEYELIW